MKINKIIAIAAVLILGIVILIGGIKISKANVLSATLLVAQESPVLLSNQVVRDLDLNLQKNLLSRQLRNLDGRNLLALDLGLLNAVELDRSHHGRLANNLGTLDLLHNV